jgi:hypothetical protein
MKTNEITSVLNEDPQAGDVLYIEAGDTLVETVIVDVLEDGIVVELDDRANEIINEGIFDKLKNVAGSVKSKIDNSVAKDALESLGYIIGVASASGFDIVQQSLGNEQFLVLSQALRMTQDSPRLRTKGSIMNGISTAKKDVEMLDSNTIAKVIKLKFEKLQRGMSYIESSAQRSPDDPPTDFMKTTRYGELDEAKYQGREVSLGKPFLTPDGPKKRSVYVKNPKGNVVKVNFGDKKLRIKKSNPKRRKSFRARHNCANPGPRWKARYWSCRAW